MVDSISNKAILNPLSRSNGVSSDHSIIAASIKLPKHKQVTTGKFQFRPITKKGMGMIEELLDGYDWNEIRYPDPSVSAAKLDLVLQGFVGQCFPLQERKTRSIGAPWFNSKTRREVEKKRRVYKREGKSERYHRARKECEAVCLEAKKNFWDGIVEKSKKMGNSRSWFQTVKMFKTKEFSQPWDISDMFPGETDNLICERVLID